ncbi:phytanoyl-CoA dioxygenase family protein [Stackebrandtia soli]|uniref:phytanoyl-CoA dioxygenase family protein n=1 Tax=Stackebrandtia soli TaxID=1892856 RepID=UPI0039E8FDBE
MDLMQFRRDGYVVLRNAVDPDLLQPFIDVLSARVAAVAEERHRSGLVPSTFDELDFDERIAAVYSTGGFVMRDWRQHLRCREYHDIVTSPQLTDPLSTLIGGEITYQGNSHLRPHLPRHLDRLPWHQDAQFYGPGIDGMLWNMVQVWLPLSDAPVDGGCMAVVPGSHRWGPIPLPDGRPVTVTTEPEAVYAATGARVRFEPTALLPMRKGDLLLFTNTLAHTGTENRSGKVRWSVDLRFEATEGNRSLTAAEERAYEVTRQRQSSRAAAPLRVRGADGPEPWNVWRRRLATGS